MVTINTVQFTVFYYFHKRSKLHRNSYLLFSCILYWLVRIIQFLRRKGYPEIMKCFHKENGDRYTVNLTSKICYILYYNSIFTQQYFMSLTTMIQSTNIPLIKDLP